MKYDEDHLSKKVVQMVEQGKLPHTLYCYKSVSEHTLDIFRKCMIWFSSPIRFNDPFDCKVYPVPPSAEYIVDNADEANFTNGFSREHLYDSLINNDIETIIAKVIDNVMSRKGILCLTPYPDNILMWSHYAQCHTGLCLMFDVMEDPRLFTYPVKVKYENEYPTFSFENRKNKDIIYSTKYSDWKYENEIRILKMNEGLHSFNPLCLKGIIFGCKTSSDDIEKVKTVISQNQLLAHIRFYRAVQDERNYRLNIVDAM